MKKKNYESISIAIVEIEIESAVLQSSTTNGATANINSIAFSREI